MGTHPGSRENVQCNRKVASLISLVRLEGQQVHKVLGLKRLARDEVLAELDKQL